MLEYIHIVYDLNSSFRSFAINRQNRMEERRRGGEGKREKGRKEERERNGFSLKTINVAIFVYDNSSFSLRRFK